MSRQVIETGSGHVAQDWCDSINDMTEELYNDKITSAQKTALVGGNNADNEHVHSASGITDFDEAVEGNSTVSGKQDALVSGVSLKTINSQTLLGPGNLVISGGGSTSAGDLVDIKSDPFNATGDGVTDDSDAIIALLAYCSSNGLTAFFSPGEYKCTKQIVIPNGVNIYGISALVNITDRTTSQGGTSNFSWVGVGVTFRMTGMKFITNKDTIDILGFYDCSFCDIDRCQFDVPVGRVHDGYVDLYSGNSYIKFRNCKFNDLSEESAPPAGGMWVREYDVNKTTHHIYFDKCEWKHNTADEPICIWGWNGTVRDVFLTDCDLEVVDGTSATYPENMVTVGNYAHTENIVYTNCTFVDNHLNAYFVKAYQNQTKPNNFSANFIFSKCKFYTNGIDNTGLNPSLFNGDDDYPCLRFIDCLIWVGPNVDRKVFQNCEAHRCHVICETDNTIGESFKFYNGRIDSNGGIVSQRNGDIRGSVITGTLNFFIQSLLPDTNIAIGNTFELDSLPSNLVFCSGKGDKLVFKDNVGCGKMTFTGGAFGLISGNEFVNTSAHSIDGTAHATNNMVNGSFSANGL